MQNNFILKEGYKYIAITFILALVVKLLICNFLGNLGLLLTIFMLFMYRNPMRDIFTTEHSILAPIDGTIKAIDYKNGKQIIYCDVNLCDTHILRAPLSGKIKVKSYINGLNLSSNSYKAKQLNEQAIIKFHNLKIKLLSGVCNSKILLDDKSEIKQGERFGLFFMGSVIIEPKKEIELSVKIGDKIKAGQTLIGKFQK